MSACVTLYVDRKLGDWTLEKHAVSKQTGFTVATGNVVTIPHARIETMAAKEILSALDSYSVRDCPELSEIDAMPRSKRVRFMSSQVIVNICEREDLGVIGIEPMEERGNGWIGDSSARMTCKRERASEELIAVIRRVLTKVST